MDISFAEAKAFAFGKAKTGFKRHITPSTNLTASNSSKPPLRQNEDNHTIPPALNLRWENFPVPLPPSLPPAAHKYNPAAIAPGEDYMSALSSDSDTNSSSPEPATPDPDTRTLKEVVVPDMKEIANALAPRQYQLELFEKAKNGNIIAVLDTGSGKTLIAVMLIKEIMTIEREERMNRRLTKLTIFLVDRVPLVFQQACVIESNCDLKVEKLCGEMGVDVWESKKWKKILEETECLVMTSQILLNMLRHAFISLDRINLLIFDECHHARGKHSYNLIMREFYDRCPERDRPKIFGMTASPMNGSKFGVQETASHLEKALNAQIFTVSNLNELKYFVNRPEEVVVDYDKPPEYPRTNLHNALWAECANFSRFQRHFSTTQQALETLGPWCADRLFSEAVLESDERPDFRQGDDLDLETLQNEEITLRRAVEIVKATPKTKPRIDDTNMFSPKVRMLVKILTYYDARPKDFCGIVFVERRHTAVVLGKLITELPELKNIKCGVLIGHGSSDEGDARMRFKEQNRVIEKFRMQEFNLLIATNVAEEGLDIQPCNVVIRFDFFRTLIAYIQSRGRARRPGSKYVIMAEQGNGDQHAILNNVRNREDEMRRWCNELPEDRKAALLDGGEDEPGSDDDDDDFDPDQSYIIPTTRAIVTLNSSVALIHYFCNALPADSFCNLRAQFDITSEGDGYVSRITLPSNSPVREVVSEVLRSKSLAKSSAALKACMLLHQKKALNDHLLPVFESEKDLMEEHRDEKGLLEGSKKRKSHYPKKVPDFWALPEGNSVVTLQTLYMTMLYVNLPDNMYDGQKYRTLCLLTRDVFPTIPAFNIFFRGVSKVVDVVPVHVPISLDHDKLEKLYTFTMKLCSSIVNKEFLCPLEEMPFLVVPLLSKAKVTPDGDGNEKLIDWDEIMKAVENRTLPVDPDDVDSLMDTVIIDHADNQRRYFVQAIRRDMTPLSPIPEGMRIRETGYESFADYYHKRFELLLERHDQPLIEVRKVSKVMNFLQAIPGVMPKQKGRVATYVVPEYCHRFSICASVFRSAMMLPSLLMRMDAFLGIREFRLSHGLHIDDHLLLEAFTTPSANMEMNYERLETLGDSFLKFVVTIRLYILFPDKHEGQLHSERIRIICNRALYKSAKELRLFKRILSMPFNRRLWRPPRFTAKIDNQPEMQDTLRDMTEHGLSDKTLADVVEASFGAAYLTGGVEAALRCCIAMQVPFDNITTWSHFNEAYVTDRHKRPVRADPKTLRSINVAKVEEITGHTFQNRLLIAEALTHASLPNSTCPCYQRLEFLGDAVLDFLVIRYLFNKYPNAAPGIMTELKDASVNNHILGAICLRVGLHRHVAHFSSKLVGAITQFVTAVSEMDKNGECVGEYWSDLDVPKVLSDVVESMLGAVFVDSGFRTEAVEHMFAKWVEPVLDKHVTPETLKVHPLKLLTTRIQQDRCSGLYLRNMTSQQTHDKSQQCIVFIHNKPVSHGYSNNIRVARKNAAALANVVLDEDPTYLDGLCDCALTKKKDEDDSEDEEEDRFDGLGRWADV